MSPKRLVIVVVLSVLGALAAGCESEDGAFEGAGDAGAPDAAGAGAAGGRGVAAVRSRAPRAAAAAAVPAVWEDAPLPSPVRLERALGRVHVRHAAAAESRPLLPGTELGRAVELSTERGGAVLDLGPAGAPAGRLWLGAWTTLRLGAGEGGGLAVTLVAGDARLHTWGADLAVRVTGVGADAAAAAAAAPRDVLLQRLHPEAELHQADAARHPEWAAWTVDLEHEVPPAAEPAGVGTLEAAGPEGAAGRLALRRLTVRARLAGDVAATEVEHVFHNGTEQRLEGTFRFPLPDGASVTGLAMEIDGALVEGELVEREKARQTYESIVREMQDPALLEWEQGQTFKLRVFPIEPQSEKRVVLRYLAPLGRGPQGRAFVYPLAAPALQERIGHVRVELEGEAVLDADDVLPERDVVVALDGDRAPAPVGREARADGTYTAVRLRPDVTALAGWDEAAAARPAALVVVLDTSRSALETRALALEATAALLGALAPEDRFALLACDVTCRAASGDGGAGLGPATPARIEAALAFAAGIEPDGASDLELALRTAGSLAREAGGTHVVYVGDGVATWGRTAPAELVAAAEAALEGVPLSAVVLGKGADLPLARELAGRLGGRVLRPAGAADVRRFAFVLRQGAGAPRLRAVRVATGANDDVWPAADTTLFEGDELLVLVRTPPDAAPPAALHLTAIGANGRAVTWAAPLAAAAPEAFVAHRWAAHHIERLESERSGAPPEDADALRQEIVRLSRDHGVLSRHTALLVLESEEAYRQHGIERRRGAGGESDPAAPQVSGADLGSPEDREASLTPDEIQPGDPEVRIPAPEDARSVVVVFPFGETKVARWEPALGLWTVRFLIAEDTPEGAYEVWVRVTHADGAVELTRLAYTVDTSRPEVTVTLRHLPGGRPRFAVVARPTVLGAAAAGGATLVSDLARVEVGLPDGRVLRLARGADGVFRGTWRPQAAVEGPVALRVVAVDRALNAEALELTLDAHAECAHE